MTTLFLDTEFNGFGGELISVALTDGKLHQFYMVVDILKPFEPWIAANVVPKLGIPQFSGSHAQVRDLFHKWITQFRNPEIICDWSADAEHFCRLLQGSDYGSSLDFACQIKIVKTPIGHPVSRMPHNALADAEALANWYNHASV